MNISDFQMLTAASLPDYESACDRWKAGVERLKDNIDEAEQLFEIVVYANEYEKRSEGRECLKKLLGFMLVDLVQMAGAAGIELEGAGRENLTDFMRMKKKKVRGETSEHILKLAKAIENVIKEGADSE